MKLPNGEKALLGDKLERYSLNMQHPKGKDKAILFRNRLGIILENKDILEVALLECTVNQEAEIHKTDNYGTQIEYPIAVSIAISMPVFSTQKH